jgi:hypothetical protein
VNGNGGKFSDRDQRSVDGQRRDDGVDSAAIGKTGIDHWLRFIDSAPYGGDDLVYDANEMLGVLEMDVGFFKLARRST